MLPRMESRSRAIFMNSLTNSCGALFPKRYFSVGHEEHLSLTVFNLPIGGVRHQGVEDETVRNHRP